MIACSPTRIWMGSFGQLPKARSGIGAACNSHSDLTLACSWTGRPGVWGQQWHQQRLTVFERLSSHEMLPQQRVSLSTFLLLMVSTQHVLEQNSYVFLASGSKQGSPELAGMQRLQLEKTLSFTEHVRCIDSINVLHAGGKPSKYTACGLVKQLLAGF